MNKRSFAFVCTIAFAVPATSIAQDAQREQALQEQVERLTRVIQVQQRALLQLEQRLRALEQRQPAPETPPPAAPPQPQAQPPAPEQPPAAPAQPPQPELADRAAEEGEEEPVKREAEPSRALETVAGEAQGFFGERYTFEPSITYSRFDRSEIGLSGFLALDAIFLGTISVDEVESDIVTTDATFRVGITNDLQVDVNVPFVYRQSNFVSGGVGGSASGRAEREVDASNLGDIGFGVNYRLFRETEVWPDIVVNARGRAPTGRDPFGIELRTVEGTQGNLQVPEQLPTGNGVWQASAGLSFLKTIDPAILFASINYFHNFQKGFDDIDAADGDQPGDVDLGDSIQAGVGMAFALNERLSLSLSYTHRIVEESRTKSDLADRFTEVVGSDANVGILNTGITYAITDNLTFVSNVGAGLTEDAADVEIRVSFPYTF